MHSVLCIYSIASFAYYVKRALHFSFRSETGVILIYTDETNTKAIVAHYGSI